MRKPTIEISVLLFFIAIQVSYGQVEVTLLGPKIYRRTEGNPPLYMDGFPGVEGSATVMVMVWFYK